MRPGLYRLSYNDMRCATSTGFEPATSDRQSGALPIELRGQDLSRRWTCCGGELVRDAVSSYAAMCSSRFRLVPPVDSDTTTRALRERCSSSELRRRMDRVTTAVGPYPRKDSNLHCLVPKTSASTHLGYGGVLYVRRRGLEPRTLRLKGGCSDPVEASGARVPAPGVDPGLSETTALQAAGRAAHDWQARTDGRIARWTARDSNPEPSGCKPGALPVELAARVVRGPPRGRTSDLPGFKRGALPAELENRA